MTTKNYGLNGIGGIVELGKGGPKLYNTSGVVEVKTNAGTLYAKLRADHPTGLNDVVTLQYLKTRGEVQVTGQINGGSPPAAGTAGRVFVCTTTGGTFTVKYLYLDDGAAWVEVIPSGGQSIGVTINLTGGAITFDGDHAYMWDDGGGNWIDIGPSSATGSKHILQRTVDIAYTDTGVINIGAAVSANGRVSGVWINVTQVFNGTAPTVTIGDAGSATRFALAAEIDLKTTGVYKLDASHLYSLSTQVFATLVPDSSTTGAANITLYYAEA